MSDSYYQRWRVNKEISLYQQTLRKRSLSPISYPIFPQVFLSHFPAIYHLLKPQPPPLLKWYLSPKWNHFFEFQFFAVNSMHVTINKHCVPFLLLICLLFHLQAPMDWTKIVEEKFFFLNTWIHSFNPPKQPYQAGASISIFYRGGNRYTEKLSNLPQVAWLIRCEAHDIWIAQAGIVISQPMLLALS